MKKALQILPILALLFSCSTKEKNDDSLQIDLTNGTYLLKGKTSADTLRFINEKVKRGDWNYKTWTITNDSIFQEDSRGLSHFLGEDRRKYILNNDTLLIWKNLKNKTSKMNNNGQEGIEKYLVLKSDKKQLVLINLNKNEIRNTTNEIRSDIQLR